MKEAAANPALHRAFGLDPAAFTTAFNLLTLHMWLIIVRLRAEGQEAANFRQVRHRHPAFGFESIHNHGPYSLLCLRQSARPFARLLGGCRCGGRTCACHFFCQWLRR